MNKFRKLRKEGAYSIVEIFKEKMKLIYKLFLFSLPVYGKMNHHFIPGWWVSGGDSPGKRIWAVEHGKPDASHNQFSANSEFPPHASGKANLRIFIKWKDAFTECLQVPQCQILLDGFFCGADIYNLKKFHGLRFLSLEQGIDIFSCISGRHQIGVILSFQQLKLHAQFVLQHVSIIP